MHKLKRFFSTSSIQYGKYLVDPFPKDLFKDKKITKLRAKKSQNFEVATKETQSTRERLLARDFIHDSLYNPNYGYFSKRAIIFSFPENVEFNKIKDISEFTKIVQGFYQEYDDYQGDEALQVWHTPTELFKPWYGYALGKYILEEHQRRYPNQPLTIYEMGAGNGTLMRNILDYIKMNDENTYNNSQYNIIEISQQLSERQEWNNMSRLSTDLQVHGKGKKVNIINKSIFHWDKVVDEPCFFIALEVIDNFAHDVIRYNLSERFKFLEPLQCHAQPMPNGDYEEVYEPVSDSLIRRYLSSRDKTDFVNPLTQVNEQLVRIRNQLPFAPNMTGCEFIPTMQYLFMEILHEKFPNHHLILSDFDSLPTPVEGLNAPIVQTRQRNTMIPCSTYLVTPGWFDIFFPTDFHTMSKIYNLIGDPKKRKSRVLSHRDFLYRYGNLQKAQTKSGEIPMLDHYKNVQFLLS